MEENIIIKSEQYDAKKLFRNIVLTVLIISAAFLLLFSVAGFADSYGYYNDCYEEYLLDGYSHGWHWYCNDYDSAFSYAVHEVYYCLVYDAILAVLLCINAGIALIGLIIYLWLRSYEMVVTDKRIYGRVAWGKRVDLPLDSVSATATLRVFKGVSVSTASGRIKFLIIKNANEMYNEINKLLIERQKKESPINNTAEAKNNTPDDLIKLKELLDMEIITQEEFDTKKKQILGI